MHGMIKPKKKILAEMITFVIKLNKTHQKINKNMINKK